MGIYLSFQVAGAALAGLVFAAAGVTMFRVYAWGMTSVTAALATAACIGAMHDMNLFVGRLPGSCRQVPQSWKRFAPSLTVALYGFCTGAGVVTRIPFAGFYLVLLACVGLASLSYGVALMVLYAAARALTVAVLAFGQAYASDPYERFTRIARFRPLAGYLNGILLASVCGLLSIAFLRQLP